MKKQGCSIAQVLLRRLLAPLLLIVSSKITQAQIPAKDSAEIMRTMNDVSSRIEAVLKADKFLYEEMTTALKKINSITDTALLDNALAAYRDKYLLQYGAIVKKAGVDMNKVASGLKVRLPDYNFVVNNTYGLEYQRQYKGPLSYEYKETTTSTTTTTSLTDFNKDKTEGCAAVSGSKVSFDGRKVHCWAGAMVAGGCYGEGVLTKETNLPGDAKSIVLKIKHTLRAKGYAVAVGGGGSCNSFGAVQVSRFSSTNNNIIVGDYVGDYAVAPILWYAKYNKEKDFSHTIDLTEFKGQHLRIIADAVSFAWAAVVCGTRGDGYATITKAELTITK